MLFIVGINLAVIAVVIVASSMFAGLAVEKGYVASKARKYPLVIGVVSLFLMMMGQTMISIFANVLKAKKGGVADALIYGWSGFIFLLCLTVLYRAYQNMKNAPLAGHRQDIEETTEE